jgi:hypothetical protein
VIGANCGVGPAELYTVATGMIGRGKPVIVQPNAGMPAAVEGRTIYVANPEHFGVFARRLLKSGVRAIGGCCGTTPAHIQAMLGALRMLGGARLDDAPTPTQQVPVITSGTGAAPRPKVVPLPERSRLGARIAAGEFAVSVEITAPAGTDLDQDQAAGRDLARGRRRHRQHRRRPARLGAHGQPRGVRAAGRRDRRRADPPRVRPRPQLPRPGRPPARRPRRWACATW